MIVGACSRGRDAPSSSPFLPVQDQVCELEHVADNKSSVQLWQGRIYDDGGYHHALDANFWGTDADTINKGLLGETLNRGEVLAHPGDIGQGGMRGAGTGAPNMDPASPGATVCRRFPEDAFYNTGIASYNLDSPQSQAGLSAAKVPLSKGAMGQAEGASLVAP